MKPDTIILAVVCFILYTYNYLLLYFLHLLYSQVVCLLAYIILIFITALIFIDEETNMWEDYMVFSKSSTISVAKQGCKLRGLLLEPKCLNSLQFVDI